LCSQAGLVRVGVVAIDGTKMHADASHHANLDYEQIAREILARAAETDRLEDEQYGETRGDELLVLLRPGDRFAQNDLTRWRGRWTAGCPGLRRARRAPMAR